MTESILAPLSESMQMYLVTIARLREDNRPVPLSHLAEALNVSPVSVNEMCRKLQDQGLLIYRPYKGALLTDVGDERACHILRRHRLWEVFLVEKLGFSYDEAHDIACQLEHATPRLLADRLDAFLDYPTVNPLGEPIPRVNGASASRPVHSLTALSPGQRGRVVRCDAGGAAQTFLEERGVRPGASLTVAATAEDSVLIEVEKKHLSLAQALAETVYLEIDEPAGEQECGDPQPIDSNHSTNGDSEMQTKIDAEVQQIPLSKLRVGQCGIVVRVGGKGPSRRRMMDMGLVPGSEVKVIRVAPLGDPIEFNVKGYSLSLRKSEAKLIKVEVTE